MPANQATNALATMPRHDDKIIQLRHVYFPCSLATEYTPEQIGAKFGYNGIDWDPSAQFIWTEGIRAANTTLRRY